MMLGGFKTEAFNAIFVEKPKAEFRINGHATFWSADDWLLYYSLGTRTWGVARASRFERVRAGQSHGSAHSPAGYDLLSGARLLPPKGWKEWDAEEGQWVKRPGSGLQSRGMVRARPGPGPAEPGGRQRPLRQEVNVSLEVLDVPPQAEGPRLG